LGEKIGDALPKKAHLWVVLLITFLLGVGVTFAEPAIGALKAGGAGVDAREAPYLFFLLNQWTGLLVLVVGAGVGLAAVVGTLRFLYGWSLKPLVYASLLPTVGVTGYMLSNPDLAKTLGLAWDCGAVTTGPVTVPLVLALGIGVASASGKGSSSLSGFGIVTLASLFPVLGVMLLALAAAALHTPADILGNVAALAPAAPEPGGGPAWFERTPWMETLAGIRAIVPLVVFLFVVMLAVLREKIHNLGPILYGLALCVLGMVVFNVGLTYGLVKLGNQSGELVPAAFETIQAVQHSPLYSFGVGLGISFLFAWFLGFGATLAEPALNALGLTVQNLTNGAFKKSALMLAVSFGVATGIGLGVFKIIFDLSLGAILIPAYLLAAVMTAFSSEEFVNIAWDSAGVTTGPVTVPLVLAMGLGFGHAMNVVEGFGILSLASIGPILAVLAMGFYINFKLKIRHVRQGMEAAADAGKEEEEPA